MGLMDAAVGAAQEVTNAYLEDKVNVNNAEHRENVMQAMNYIENNEVLDRQTVKGLGILDEIDATDPQGNKLDVVPRHMWRTAYLARVVEDSRQAHADNIGGGKVGQEWLRTTQAQDDKLLAHSIEQTSQDAYDYLQKDMVNRRELYKEQGRWDMVEEIESSQIYADIYASSPALRDMHQLEVAQGRENARFDDMMIQGRYDEVMLEASDKDRDTSLSQDDLRRIYFEAETKRDGQLKDEQARVERQQDKVYMEMVDGLIRRERGMEDVLATKEFLPQPLYDKLITLERSLLKDAAGDNSLDNKALMSAFTIPILKAGLGVLPDSAANMEDFKRQMVEAITDAGAGFDEVSGMPFNGLTGPQMVTLMEQLEGIEDKPYTTRAYDNVIRQMELRIMRSDDDTGFSLIAKEDSALLMADATKSLTDYIAENGPTANLAKWEKEQLPHYYTKAAQAAMLGLDKTLQKYIVTSPKGEEFSIDFQETEDGIQKRIDNLVTKGNDPAALESYLREFQDYRDKYEGMIN
jgi:hypothetical protein